MTAPTSSRPRLRRSVPRALKTIFGIASLRDGQRAVIDAVLAGRDTLAIMPTGAGKSLCYQVPAVCLPGVTVVVSPLIALMRDQVGKLDELGVAADEVNSTLARREETEALGRIAEASNDVVFVTPERLAQPEFLATLAANPVSLLAIDEAHCLSSWGHDFRPAYLEIKAAREALGRPPVLALTATATPDVIDDIVRQLGMRAPCVINTGIYRANLAFEVVQVTNETEQLATALALVREREGPGIVYAATVKAVESLHAALVEAGVAATLYHGRLPARERSENQQRFMSGDCRVMVATNAFGMGIDKADSRFVLHYQIPASLEAYYQEAGRAGRDGEPARCTLLFNQKDKRVQQFFLARHYPDAESLRAVRQAVESLAGGGPFPARSLPAALPDMPPTQLKVTLKLLKDGRYVAQDRALNLRPGRRQPSAADFDRLAEVYRAKQERDREALERVVGYARSGYCRWRLLLEYFGEEGAGQDCGQCDNCLRMAQEAAAPAEAPAAPAPEPPTARDPIAVGAVVSVPKHPQGSVVAVADDTVTIAFPDLSSKVFLRSFVTVEPSP
jgi:ATP-dependent DNA helicase RecQ